MCVYVYKYGGINLTKSLVKLINNIWDSSAVPQEIKDATIVHIYKRKGDKSICDNHRGIYLLCIAGKILTRILLNRLSLHLADNVLPESQCGFRAQRSTIDMIFAARQVQEKYREQNLDLYMVFVDLTKVFDTISRDGLWQILRKIGCHDLSVDIIRSFHEGMVARVQDQGQTSESFSVTNGTKQGCVMAPLLFIPKDVFYGELDAGHRTRGGQQKRYKDVLKAKLKSCGIPHNNWETTATDRTLWRSTCHSGLRDYEEKRCDALRDKRMRRKAIQSSSNIDIFLCHVCGRLCASRIGLHSHNRTHANTNTD